MVKGPFRLVVCSVGVPHPSRDASLAVLYNYLQGLKNRGFEILHVIALVESKGANKEYLESYKNEMCDDAFTVLVWETEELMKPRKHIYSAMHPSALPGEINEKILEYKPDMAFCFDIYGAGLMKDVPVLKLVQVHDLRFHTIWYHSWYFALEHPRRLLGLPFAWVRSNCIRSFYRRVLSTMDRVLVICKSSERVFERMGIHATYVPYAWAVEGQKEPINSLTLPAKPTFLFFGNLRGLGSRSALHFLLDKVYKRLITIWGSKGFDIIMCGAYELPDWVREKVVSKPEILFKGFVEDLPALMRHCHAVLVPISVPVGNRTRIHHAMALGSLVIAHKNTALGNPGLVDGKTCYLAGNSHEFAERMKYAFECPDDSLEIVKRAREFYNSNYRSDVATIKLIGELNQIASKKVGT
ncbi:glycosyltransferase [Patescibacteria group bacterium]|nr:glycosyltransferase [Patescibacteria group bacterium]